MNKMLLILLLLALAATAQQQKRIAIVNTVDDGDRPITVLELSHLTDRLREIANKTLPPKSYAIMTQQSILAYLGSMDKMVKKCKESEGCLAKLGREVNADYVCQARIGRFGKDLTIKAELYESKNGDLISSFTGTSKNIYGLLSVLDKESPEMFKRIEGNKEIPSIPTPPPTPQKSKETAPSTPIYGNTLHDSRDGKTYRTVKIGSQIWMAENMNYDAKGSKCYKNNPDNCTKYGRMYNWETAMKACPSGWHLPSNDEWDVLHNYAGGSYAGIKLKARSGWYSCGASNSSHYPYCEDTYGFSALPGGYGYLDGSFDLADTNGHWWSANEGEGSSTSAHNRFMRYDDRGIYGSINDKEHLLSVRCLKD